MNFIITRIFACALILYGYIVTRRSAILRITFGIFWIYALGAGSAPSKAQSSPAPGEKKPEQVTQPINFRQPEPLDFDDHTGYVSIFDGTCPSLKSKMRLK